MFSSAEQITEEAGDAPDPGEPRALLGQILTAQHGVGSLPGHTGSIGVGESEKVQ
jgi:hypothetical protein